MSDKIDFPHTLNSTSLGVCLTEIVKYILYMQAQVPLPLDQLLEPARFPDPKDSPEEKKSIALPWREKQLHDKLERAHQLLTNLQAVCEVCSEGLKEMAVVLGATLIHPSAVFSVRLEPGLLSHSSPNLVQENLKRFIVKNLISFNFEVFQQNIPPINCFVLLKALRSLKIASTLAVPRLTLQLTTKKNYVCIEVASTREYDNKETRTENKSQPMERPTCSDSCRGSHSSDAASSSTECSVEWENLLEMMQGISLANEGEQEEEEEEDEAEEKCSGDGRGLCCGCGVDEEEWVWFQVLPVFQGFHQLPHRPLHRAVGHKGSLKTNTTSPRESTNEDSIWA